MGRILGNSRAFTWAIVGLAAASAYAEVETQGLRLPHGVAVIDEGVDLEHKALKGNADTNNSVDTDFKDESAGWNIGSNNANYFPAFVRKAFTQNAATVAWLFDLWSKVENDDAEARAFFKENPRYYRIVSMLLEKSHGTHVAGITVQRSEQHARIKSLNVFTKDQASPANVGARLSQRLSQALRLQDDPEAAAAGESVFDDLPGINALIAKIEEEEVATATLMSKYIKAKSMGVSNLSLGSAQKNVRAFLESAWEEDVAKRGLPAGTPRNAQQEANFQHALHGVWGALAKGWKTLFSDNPNVLFVVAAGNDGDPNVPDAGNNDVSPTLPSNLSSELPNVISIAATDKNGLLTDFSNYGETQVNLGALGKAVMSTAPADNTVGMSGTSMASPFVAGVASEIRQINPHLTAVETRRILEKTGRPLDGLKGKISTGALVDPQAAFAAAKAASFWGVDAAIMLTVRARDNEPFKGIDAGSLRKPSSLVGGSRVSQLMNRHLVRAINGRGVNGSGIVSSNELVRDMVARTAH